MTCFVLQGHILNACIIIKENYMMNPPELRSCRFIYERIIYVYSVREASLNTFSLREALLKFRKSRIVCDSYSLRSS